MRVFLTGAVGLLGSHVSEQLLAQGAQVSALVRSVPERSFLGNFLGQQKASSRIEVIHGDLNDPSAWQAQLHGKFDAVIHCAALATADPSRKEEVWRVNFEGTQKIFEVLRPLSERWIHISSISTMCDGQDPLVDESFQGHVRKTPYGDSKFAADQWIEAQDKTATILHPCFMIDRWDARPSSGALFMAIKSKKFQTYQNSTKNFVAARDVAAGVLLALNKNVQGHFILGNENLTLKEFFHKMCSELNIPFELTEENLNENSPGWPREFCSASAVNWDKAHKQLSYSPKLNVDAMLKEAMDYFEEHKMLRRGRS